MGRIKVAFLIGHMKDGGAQRIVLNYLLDLFYDSILQIKLFVLDKRNNSWCEREIDKNRFDVFYLYSDKSSKSSNLVNRFLLKIKFLREFIKYSPDIIHGHITPLIHSTIVPIIMSRAKKVFFTLHSNPFRIQGSDFFFARLGFNKLGIIPVCLNEEQAKMAQQHYGFKHYEILHNGVDFEKIRKLIISKDEARKAFGVDGNSLVLCACGRLNKVKNYPLMLDIFNKLLSYIKQNGLPRHLKMARNDDSIFVDAVLLIAGDGPEKESLVKYTEKLGISDKVKFLGNLDNVVPLYCSADVFLLTSHSESMSLVLMEAQTCGCKCFISAGVPKESIITDKVVSMKEDASVEDWVNAILTEKVTYEKPRFTEADYEVHAMSQKCKEMYLKYLNKQQQ